MGAFRCKINTNGPTGPGGFDITGFFFDKTEEVPAGRINGVFGRSGLFPGHELRFICKTKTNRMQMGKSFLLLIAATGIMHLYSSAQDSLRVRGTISGSSGRADTTKFNQVLRAVTIRGSRPLLVQRSGKIILNVAESPLASGGNAFDILRRLPGVLTQEESLQWHGRSLRVLIDGRMTGLSGGDLKAILEAMPAGTIGRVELIESPSARYDAQGSAVINIVTVKTNKAGANGILTAGTGGGRHLRYNAGLSGNYRQGSWNIYGSYDHQHSLPYYSYYSDRPLDSARRITEHTDGTRQSDDNLFRLGADHVAGKKSSFGILVKGMLNYRKQDAFNRSELTGGTDSLSTVTTMGRSRLFIPSVNGWYKWTFDSTGRELTINADYLHYDKSWSETFTTRYFDPKGIGYADPFLLRDRSPSDNRIRSVAVDYIYPSKIARLEMGVKWSSTVTDNDVRWEQHPGIAWLTDSSKTNHFIYRENIGAVYLQADRSLKTFEIQAGLRVEQTGTEGHSLTLGEVNARHYLNVFPSVSVQYTLPRDRDQQFNLSYRKSIERYDFDVVNPFVRYISQYSYYRGNADIRPSITNTVSLSYSWKDILFPSVSYGHYADALGDVYTRVDSSNAVVSSNANLGSADQWTADLSGSKSLFGNRWTINNSTGILYAKYNTPSVQQARARWSVYASSDNVISFSKGWKVEVSGQYYSSLVLGVFTYRSRYSADMGISRSLWKAQGRLAMNVTDVFNTLSSRYDIASDGVVSSNRRKTESRVFRLVFTYKFGSRRLKAAATRKTGIDDLRGRMQGN
jgi:hypothetical protein